MLTRLPAAPALLLTVLVASACGAGREARAHAAQEEQVRDLARQAAAMATGTDSSDSAAIRRSPVHRATIPNRLAPPGDLSVPDSVGAAASGGAASGGAAPGALRIVSTNGSVVYTLLRDTVRMQLSDSVVGEVRRKMESSADSGSGFGGFLKHTVAGAVGSAMGFVVRTPVRDVRSARYEHGELRIESNTGIVGHGTFAVGGKNDRGKDRTVFAPADAERFVAAVNARRRALGAQ